MSKQKIVTVLCSPSTDYLLSDLKIHTCGNNCRDACSCESVEQVNVYKYIGVLIDYRLNWSDHVAWLKNKIRRYQLTCITFRQLNDILTWYEIIMAYYAYVVSIVSYVIIEWSRATNHDQSSFCHAKKS